MDSSRTRRQYYDDVHYSPEAAAERAERKMTVADPWYQLILDFLRRQDVPVEGRTVLEVGCGLGGFAAHLARHGADVTAADFSFSAVAMAALLGSDAGEGAARRPRHVTADARRLPFQDGAFDLVVCAETLEHTFALDDCLREFARVCSPGGHVAVTVPNSLLSLPLDVLISQLGVGQPQSPVNYFSVRRAALAAGLDLADAYGANFFRLMFSEDVLPRSVRRVTERIGAGAERFLPRENPIWVLAAGTVGFLLHRPAELPLGRSAEQSAAVGGSRRPVPERGR